mgnify:CR=1 FL=1
MLRERKNRANILEHFGFSEYVGGECNKKYINFLSNILHIAFKHFSPLSAFERGVEKELNRKAFST